MTQNEPNSLFIEFCLALKIDRVAEWMESVLTGYMARHPKSYMAVRFKRERLAREIARQVYFAEREMMMHRAMRQSCHTLDDTDAHSRDMRKLSDRRYDLIARYERVTGKRVADGSRGERALNGHCDSKTALFRRRGGI